jgi:guanyl-specific ribonuclease Sa
VGDDLSIHEITNGPNSYPEEKALIEVSADGIVWVALAENASSKKNETGPSITMLDLAGTGLPEISYVRVTDISNVGPFEQTADGFDLDSVDAVYGTCTQ